MCYTIGEINIIFTILKGWQLMEKNYQLLYYYASLDADTTISIRIPHELKEGFQSVCKDGNISKAIREFMVHEIAIKGIVLPNDDGTYTIKPSNLFNRD